MRKAPTYTSKHKAEHRRVFRQNIDRNLESVALVPIAHVNSAGVMQQLPCRTGPTNFHHGKGDHVGS